jgi:F420H(2)-dependent quinone reductase
VRHDHERCDGPTNEASPAWFKHKFRRSHRTLHRLSGGRFLWTPASKRGWGAGVSRQLAASPGGTGAFIVGYIEDGPNLVMLATNGWDEGRPAWWLNLEAQPDATVRLARHRPFLVHASIAEGEERLWQRWAEIDVGLDAYASGRSSTSPVVVLEPRGERIQVRNDRA